MAYLKEIRHICEWPECTLQTTYRLISGRNEALGEYCRRHGAMQLKLEERSEDAARAQRRDDAERVYRAITNND